ncbi:hypothetical protein CH063_05226 [Colletotrichum higginsianum]|uniref:Uncharacterized protein n=1 Tax=Colletotrichum higginsianum (strain IMI 349063) TaxID=759273 RepID=H1UY94_COLHI|nr:hypothetical protein CH063_05226 [Colletotrichum higginsianum]
MVEEFRRELSLTCSDEGSQSIFRPFLNGIAWRRPLLRTRSLRDHLRGKGVLWWFQVVISQGGRRLGKFLAATFRPWLKYMYHGAP